MAIYDENVDKSNPAVADMSENEPIIHLENVFLRSERGMMVFRELNLTLETGRSAVIVGPAGSGKTLLVRLLTGLQFVDEGKVCVLGREIRKRRPWNLRKVRKRIGGVGGPFDLVPSLTVAENITLPLVIGGERRKAQKDRLLRMLSEFSLLRQAGEYPSQLTRVEKTLVMFARASIANQPLMIIDEPAAGLDLATTGRVFEWLTKVSLSGRSMLIVASEKPRQELPNTDYYTLQNGVLA